MRNLRAFVVSLESLTVTSLELSLDMEALETRNMIHSKANEIFEEHGPYKFTLNQLIEETGVTKGKFYYHFNSLFELVYEVLIKGNLQVESYYDEIKDTMDPPKLLSSIII